MDRLQPAIRQLVNCAIILTIGGKEALRPQGMGSLRVRRSVESKGSRLEQVMEGETRDTNWFNSSATNASTRKRQTQT